MYTRVAVDGSHVVSSPLSVFPHTSAHSLRPLAGVQDNSGKFGCALRTLYIQVDMSAIDLPFQRIDGK